MSLFNTIMAEVEDGAKQQAPVEGENIPDATGQSAGETAAEPPKWWLDDDTPGSGDRPVWLPEKYKSASDVAKAYKELEKKFGTAPEKYDWSKGAGWAEPEYEHFQELESYAKSKHVPQDVFDKMLESVGTYLNEFKVDYTEEKAKLGDNVAERLNVLNNWAKSNFSEDTYHALTANMKTADAVKAIEEMRTKMIENNTTIPTGNEATAHSGATLESVQQELTDNIVKYQNDASYRKAITAKLEAVANQSHYVDKAY